MIISSVYVFQPLQWNNCPSKPSVPYCTYGRQWHKSAVRWYLSCVIEACTSWLWLYDVTNRVFLTPTPRLNSTTTTNSRTYISLLSWPRKYWVGKPASKQKSIEIICDALGTFFSPFPRTARSQTAKSRAASKLDRRRIFRFCLADGKNVSAVASAFVNQRYRNKGVKCQSKQGAVGQKDGVLHVNI